MNGSTAPKLAKWPFFAGDALLLLAAYLILWQSGLPMSTGPTFIMAGCVTLGAGLAVLPFLLEYRATAALLEVEQLRSATLQIQNIEAVARQIASATACWQAVQDEASKAVNSAREIAESMTTEAKAFQEFLTKANDTERSHLRLEVEKLHRAQQDWLTIVVRMLDHTYALYRASVRSGQPNLISELEHFQNACRDVARRVGLVPFQAEPGDTYDAQLHQLPPSEEPPTEGAAVAGTLATGYRFQGQLLRRAMVTVAASAVEAAAPSSPAIEPVSETPKPGPAQDESEYHPPAGRPFWEGTEESKEDRPPTEPAAPEPESVDESKDREGGPELDRSNQADLGL